MKVIKNFSIEGKHQKPIVTDVFYTKTARPKKIIIFCHGYKGFKDWGAWNLLAAAFSEAGFFFIKFNFSHNGGTAEQPIDFPDLEAFGNNNYTKELDDLASVIDWISANSKYKEEVNIEEISIIGHSRGGGIVTLKAAEDLRVKKVITLASVCDFASRSSTISDLEAWKKTGVKYVVNGRTKQQRPHFYQFYLDFIENEERLTIEKSVRKMTIPHFIIHGDNDPAVSIKEGKKLHSWNPKSIFKIIKNANHVFNVSHPWTAKKMTTELEEVTQLCVAFLK